MTGKEGGSVAQSGIYVGGIVVQSAMIITIGLAIPIYTWPNTGNHGGQFVGGIMGCFDGRGSTLVLTSITAKTAVRSSQIQTERVVSWRRTAPIRHKEVGIRLDNCLNTGAVKYANAETAKPLVGGIAGAFSGGRIYNCYTSWNSVTPVSGSPVRI